MSSTSREIAQDARFLAQERIVDALLRALALQEQSLIRPRLECARRLRAALRQWLRATPPGDCKHRRQGG